MKELWFILKTGVQPLFQVKEAMDIINANPFISAIAAICSVGGLIKLIKWIKKQRRK